MSTSALNVKVTEIQTSVGESSFGSGRVFTEIFKVMGIQTSGCEIVDILKKFKDADPADSHHASLFAAKKQHTNTVTSEWRSSPQSMREDLENIYALFFWFLGNGFQLALCNVGGLATWKFVVLVADPIVFAPWSVLLERGELGDSCQDAPHEAACASLPSQADKKRPCLSVEWLITGESHTICAPILLGEGQDDAGSTVPRTITSPPAG